MYFEAELSEGIRYLCQVQGNKSVKTHYVHIYEQIQLHMATHATFLPQDCSYLLF